MKTGRNVPECSINLEKLNCRLIAFVSVVAMTALPAFADRSVAVAAEGESLLKPGTPKLDTPVETKPHTLKGSVQHHARPNLPPRNAPLSGKVKGGGQRGNLASPGSGALDRRKPLNAHAGNQSLTGQTVVGIGIIGVKFMMSYGQPPVINKVFPGTPAWSEGVRPDDIIVAVDGVPTYGLTKEEVYDLIVGTPNTAVTLSLRRGSDFSVRKMQRMDFNDITDPNVKRDYMLHM